MAKDYEVNLKVNTGSSVKDLTDLENVLSDIGDELVPLTSQMGEMEDKLMLMAYAGDTTSAEFQKLSLEVAGMRKTIRETDAGLEALSMTTTQKVSGAISGAASGFEAFQGAMGAFGVESEQVEAALLKVQSAMALTQGVQGIKEALPSFQALKTGAVDTFNKMTTAGKAFALTGIGLLITAIGSAIAYFDDLKEMFDDTSVSQKALNESMEDYRQGATNATMVTNDMKAKFDLAKKGVLDKDEVLKEYNSTLGKSLGTAEDFNSAEKIFNDKTGDYVKSAAKRAQAQMLITKAAELQAKAMSLTGEDYVTSFSDVGDVIGAAFTDGIDSAFEEGRKKVQNKLNQTRKDLEKSSQEILSQAEKLVSEAVNIEKGSNILSDAQIKAQEEAEARAEEAEQKRKERAEAYKQWVADQKSMLAEITQAHTDYENSKKSEEDQEVIASQQKWDALIKNAEEYKLSTKQLLLDKEDEEKAIRKKYADEQIQAEKDKQDAINKLIKEARENDLQTREDFDQAYYEATTSAEQQELDLLGEKYFSLIKQAELYEKDVTQLNADWDAKRKEITDKYAAERQLTQDEINAKELEREKLKHDRIVQGVEDAFTTISNLTQLFAGKSEKAQKRAFQVQKAVQIAQAVMDTYKAANMALSSAPPPFNFIAMAAAITSGLVNVKTIMAQKFEASSASGGGSTSIPSTGGGGTTNVMTPNFNVVGNSGINQLAQVAGQPIQAYVVSGQITTAQSLDRNKIENATL